MNQKEIKELIELLVEKDITEFELERGDVKVHVKRGSSSAPTIQFVPSTSAIQPPPIPAPSGAPPSFAVAATPASSAPSASASPDPDLFVVKSPIVGTYYEAPSPGTPPFVKVGDAVQEGQVLCIIEAMKLMNEIEAEVSGVIEKMFVANGSPVEYGLPLFGIRQQ
jgi:acetyl-CoA carboxylase biotin carboxyl carrier protein